MVCTAQQTLFVLRFSVLLHTIGGHCSMQSFSCRLCRRHYSCFQHCCCIIAWPLNKLLLLLLLQTQQALAAAAAAATV
jgi:hypothetical protein